MGRVRIGMTTGPELISACETVDFAFNLLTEGFV